MPGTGRSVYAHYLIWVPTVPGDKDCFYLSFADKETEAQGGKSVGLERDAGSKAAEWKASSIWSRGKICGIHTLHASTTQRLPSLASRMPCVSGGNQVPGNTMRAPRARDPPAEPRSRSHTEQGPTRTQAARSVPSTLRRVDPSGPAGEAGPGDGGLPPPPTQETPRRHVIYSAGS